MCLQPTTRVRNLCFSTQVKELIKRAKAWRNGEWPKEAGGSGRPKSYMLSVMVLSAYEKASLKVGTSNIGRIARQ